MMDKMMAKITGSEVNKAEVSGIRKKEDVAFSKTELSPGLEKQWDSKMAAQAQSVEDKAKTDELRQRIADVQASHGLAAAYGGKEEYLKAVQESTKDIGQKLAAKEEMERQQIAEQQKAKLSALERRSSVFGIEKDLEVWQQREGEEKARRERLDLE
ncbi:MAG: hypothetical protein PHC70_01495 [Patescibacteria group bacterium]|nr:hypothetical protein [Patescibacteria group bacterium]